MSKAFSEDAVRTRAYLMWEADGRPFGRDDHYWGLALAELSAPAKQKRTAAKTVAKPAAKTSKPKAAARPAAKASAKTVAKAPVAKAKPKKK